MANRRMGGAGGGQRGNRSFSQHQPFQGSGVSPWQGNMPSNNSMNQGLLSQITSNPQQLALALTSLLQPQQQPMNNPPSLLSLNTSPAFSNQDRDFNRFGNRGRDFRRHEPYNKLPQVLQEILKLTMKNVSRSSVSVKTGVNPFAIIYYIGVDTEC